MYEAQTAEIQIAVKAQPVEGEAAKAEKPAKEEKPAAEEAKAE